MAGVMGSTGTVNVSPEMLSKAKSAIDSYRTTITGLAKELDDVMKGLIPANFSGSAADGMNYFYDQNVEPVIVGKMNQLLASLDDIVDGIMEAIPAVEGVDEQLAEENKNIIKEEE